MRDDFRSAIRTLRASKTFTAVAVTVLALGIGATTAIFSVVDAVVLRALPFDEHDRLVAVGERHGPVRAADPEAVNTFSPQNYLDVAASQQVFEAMAGVVGGGATLREPGAAPEVLRTQRVTADFFRVLREPFALGGSFRAENEIEGNDRVCVLSHGFWQSRLAGDRAIVGKALPLADGPCEVVGVTSAAFSYPVGVQDATELWMPWAPPAADRVRHSDTKSFYVQAIARLKPGVTIQQARANLGQIGGALQQSYPDWNKSTSIVLRPLRDQIVDAKTSQWMWMLLGAVGLVLLIACANVANLLLARVSTRERELTVRAALGAARGRLIRQLLVESLSLAVLGTAAAVLLAEWGVAVLRQSIPAGVPRVSAIAVDLRVLGAAATLAIVTGLLFGLAPALQFSRPELTGALREDARGATADRRRFRFRGAVVVAEVALAVVLLVAASLFIGSFRTLMHVDPGFRPEHVLTAWLQPRIERQVPGGPLPDASGAFAEIVDRLSRAPRVIDVGFTSPGLPMWGGAAVTTVGLPRRTLDHRDAMVGIHQISPGYFRALGIPLKQGREFTSDDRKDAAQVVIISEIAARLYFPGASAVGQAVTINGPRVVVGVVGDVHSLEVPAGAEAYVPMAQQATTSGALALRTTGDPYEAVAAARTATLAVLPDVPLRYIQSMGDIFAARVALRRFNMLLMSLFGLLGLLISAVGIYGVLANLVAQRERELGIRVALGATPAAIVGLVVGGSARLVAAGLVAGGSAAWMLSGTAKAYLFRMDVNDPRVYIAAVGAIVVASFVATAIPARRAASVDPAVSLRRG